LAAVEATGLRRGRGAMVKPRAHRQRRAWNGGARVCWHPRHGREGWGGARKGGVEDGSPLARAVREEAEVARGGRQGEEERARAATRSRAPKAGNLLWHNLPFLLSFSRAESLKLLKELEGL